MQLKVKILRSRAKLALRRSTTIVAVLIVIFGIKRMGKFGRFQKIGGFKLYAWIWCELKRNAENLRCSTIPLEINHFEWVESKSKAWISFLSIHFNSNAHWSSLILIRYIYDTLWISKLIFIPGSVISSRWNRVYIYSTSHSSCHFSQLYY